MKLAANSSSLVEYDRRNHKQICYLLDQFYQQRIGTGYLVAGFATLNNFNIYENVDNHSAKE